MSLGALSPLSNTDREKLRKFACENKDAKRVTHEEDQLLNTVAGRSPFNQDRDRILFSKAFRRLAHKTQVFLTSEKEHNHSDHTRTRLTHTLEVATIGKSMARYLCLNEDLVEAMAYGHDVGHAPFGHAGEDQLNDLLNGKTSFRNHQIITNWYKDDAFKNSDDSNVSLFFGDFKHNFQSIRQLAFLESSMEEFSGLNLTYQCLDGVLRHTGLKNIGSKERDCVYPESRGCGVLYDLLNHVGFEPTIEARVIQIADEIAQVSHDLYDALDLGVIAFSDLVKDKLKDEFEAMEATLTKIGKDCSSFEAIPEGNPRNMALCSRLVFYFTIVTVEKLRNQLLLASNSDPISSVLATLTDEPLEAEIFNCVKAYKDDLVINNYSVNRMDNKGRYIIRKLFNAYVTDPRQLPDQPLKMYLSLKQKEMARLGNDDFRYWVYSNNSKLKPGISVDSTGLDQGIDLLLNCQSGPQFRAIKPKIIKQIIPFLFLDGDYVRVIVDYIASMTDSFAEKEVNSLYGI